MKKLLIILCLLLISIPALAVDADPPTTQFRTISNLTPVASLDTAAERLAAIADQTVVSTGHGNEVVFLKLDVSDASQNSAVRYIIWNITDGGADHTEASAFKVWGSSIGFNNVDSIIKFQPISGGDQGSPSDTENYVLNATTASYSWGTMPESEPGSQNVYPSDEGSTLDMTNDSSDDDVIMFAVYLAIDTDEAAGYYFGTKTGYELQLSFKYTYE